MGNNFFDVPACSDRDVDSGTFVSLTFTNQKNSVCCKVSNTAFRPNSNTASSPSLLQQ